jgi:hypothetical protein
MRAQNSSSSAAVLQAHKGGDALKGSAPSWRRPAAADDDTPAAAACNS